MTNETQNTVEALEVVAVETVTTETTVADVPQPSKAKRSKAKKADKVEAKAETDATDAATQRPDYRTKVRSVRGPVDAELITEMRNVSAKDLSAMKGRITRAISARDALELSTVPEGQTVSKDVKNYRAWSRSDSVARLFVVLKIDPVAYLMQSTMTDADMKKHGLDSEAVTRNLKACKKVVELAEYIQHGPEKHLEGVVKTFVACSILAARRMEVIPRSVCSGFLRSAELVNVSDDLRDAIDAFQAKHMSGGAETQASQCILTLANLGCGSIVRDGRDKNLKLNRESLIIAALAARFGMSQHLAQAS